MAGGKVAVIIQWTITRLQEVNIAVHTIGKHHNHPVDALNYFNPLISKCVEDAMSFSKT
jgi:hypothetical protein